MARNPVEIERWRIRFLVLGMVIALGFLLLDLHNLQVRRGATWEQRISKQSIRRIRLPETRGRILDRNQELLADNRANYNVSLWLEELRQPGRGMSRTVDKAMDTIDELAWRLKLPAPIQREDVVNHFRQLLPFPLKIWEDVDPEIVAQFSEKIEGIPGVGLETIAKREYPHDDMACHILGYVRPVEYEPLPQVEGEEDTAPPQEKFHYYLPQLKGRAGIERIYDDRLGGKSGGQSIRVDVFGYRHEVLATRLPENGDDMVLNLDKRIQALTEDVLDEELGAAIVMDPRNGEVLGMGSYPRFNLNDFTGERISQEVWSSYNDNPERPLVNRATNNHYPPGSIFKPVVALAGLESGKFDVHTTFYCPGHYQLGRGKKYCGTRSGHGDTALVYGLEGSCNVYYWKMMERMDYAYTYRMAAAFGFGSRTGIEVEGEVPGRLPNATWKRRKLNEGWSLGDSINVAIGQGYLDVTPLQMVSMVSTIANGGTLYQPRLVRGFRDERGRMQLTQPIVKNRFDWKPENLAGIREGMRRVVMSDEGTGRLARVEGVTFCGKTGTAQYGRRDRWRTWMVGYLPAENPRYAMVVFLEEQPNSSGIAVGPRMKRLVEGLVALEEGS